MGIIIRTVIILPVLLFLIPFMYFMTAFLDPVFAEVVASSASQGTWGGVESTVYWYFVLAIGILILGLLAWHVIGPIREDVHRRRVR